MVIMVMIVVANKLLDIEHEVEKLQKNFVSIDYEIFVKIQKRESIDNAWQDKENKYYIIENQIYVH